MRISCACRPRPASRRPASFPPRTNPFPRRGCGHSVQPSSPPPLPRHSTPRAGSESTRKPRKRVLINHQFPRAICEGSSLAADTARPEAKNESSNEHRIYGPRFSPPGDICRGRASSSDLSLTHPRFRSLRIFGFGVKISSPPLPPSSYFRFRFSRKERNYC